MKKEKESFPLTKPALIASANTTSTLTGSELLVDALTQMSPINALNTGMCLLTFSTLRDGFHMVAMKSHKSRSVGNVCECSVEHIEKKWDKVIERKQWHRHGRLIFLRLLNVVMSLS